MRILHIINSLEIGGAEKLIVDSLPIYREKEIDVELLVLKESKTFLYSQVLNYKIPVYFLRFKSVYNPIIVLKLIPYLKKYDILHVHLFPAQYWVVFAKILSFLKISLLFTEHSNNNRRWKNNCFYIFDYISYSKFAKIVCITKQVKQAFDEYMPKMSIKSVVIENGINIPVFKEVAEVCEEKSIDLSISSSDKLLIQVSAFRDEKDQDTLIKCMKYLPENVKLILVGDGKRLATCKELVSHLALQNRVFFLGKRNDVPVLLKTADIAIQSSHWEGFGLAAVEAMAAGTPILVSDVPGLANVVGHPQLRFEKGNEKMLANKIQSLLNNEQLYKEIVDYGLERANNYSIHTMVHNYITLYKELVYK